MFGRRKVPFGSGGQDLPPPPPAGKEPFPIEKMDRALDSAIRLFTRTLDDAGVDAGELAIRGDVPANVTGQLAECTTYRGEDDGGLTFLALGITADFKAFMYPPHCRLFLIINSTGICEDPHTQSFLKTLAPAQLPGPIVDAHMMRTWIRFILPTADAMKQGAEALNRLHQRMMDDMTAVVRRVPPVFRKAAANEGTIQGVGERLPRHHRASADAGRRADERPACHAFHRRDADALPCAAAGGRSSPAIRLGI